jgi:lactoylglutathione lyase
MTRVTGIGGIFFKAQDQQKLQSWYSEHLGIESEGESGHTFSWREHDAPDKTGMTVWSIFPGDTKYFDPGISSFMINYRVEDLPALMEQLRREGVTVDSEIQEFPYGRFAWISDPEGNRIELWEPAGE